MTSINTMPVWSPPPNGVIAETERLLLRVHTPEDAAPLHEHIESDPEVTRYTGGTHTLEETIEDLRILAETMANNVKGLGSWAVIDRATGEYIGYTLLKPFRVDDVELGYAIARDRWGQGLGTEAARATLWHAFEHLHLAEIVAAINLGNKASARVAEKIGMKRRGLIPWPQQGDVDLYAIRAVEFKATS